MIGPAIALAVMKIRMMVLMKTVKCLNVLEKLLPTLEKTIWTHLKNNMKEQLVLLVGELGKLISSDVQLNKLCIQET